MNILTINTSQLQPGMIVAEDVITPRNEKIILRNTILTQENILKLNLSSIKQITVCIPNDLANYQSSKEIPYINKLKSSTEFKNFYNNYTKASETLKNSFVNLMHSNNTSLVIETMSDCITNLVPHTQNTLRTFDILQCLRENNDMVYVHSLNVAMICFSFASWLNYSAKETEQLLLAGMLHDIGKLKIPEAILHKPFALTPEEYKLIQQHPVLGYAMVKDLNLDTKITNAILMHHERTDGSGYPAGKMSADITDFAKIIAIADVYDAMTANRTYRNGYCVFHVIDIFEKEGYQKYDPKFLLPFLKNLALSYLHATVKLSNSLTGEVVMINNHSLSRPIVKVDSQFFDLSKEKDITIINVLS